MIYNRLVPCTKSWYDDVRPRVPAPLGGWARESHEGPDIVDDVRGIHVGREVGDLPPLVRE